MPFRIFFHKISLLFAAGLFCCSLSIFGQSLTIDEQLALSDEIKSTDFNRFSSLLLDLEKRLTELDTTQLEELNYLQAYQLAYTGHQEAALTKLLDLAARSSSKEIKLKSYGLAINSLVISRKYSEVFKYYDAFTGLLSSVNNNYHVSHALSVIAIVFNQINQIDIALYYAERLIETTEIDRFRCIGMQIKADTFFRSNEREKFNSFYDEALKSCREAKQPIFAGIIQSYKIEQLIESDPTVALSALDEKFEEVSATSYPILITLYKALYSKTYLELGQTETALKIGKETLKGIKADEINYSVLTLYSTLYKAAKELGKFKDALAYQDMLVQKQRTFENEKMAGLLAYQLAKADVEVKNQRIELLNKDNELLFLQKNLIEEEARQTRVLMAVLALLLSITLYLAYKGLTGRHRFKKIAEFDQLTGISNRYHFNTQAELALDFCQKNSQPAAVILFDLDHFKQINDNHGHAAGDWALQAVVGTCRHFMRNNDVFGRIGGEEFAVVLPGCQTDKAALLAEICRDAIAAIDTEESGTAFPLTASFGVSGSDTSGYQLKQLLADADKAMYRAKDGGRDQVVSFAEA